MDVKFRKFKLCDLCRLVSLLDKEWELGDRESSFGRKVYSLIYAMEVLKGSNVLLSYTVNGSPIGFVGYGSTSFSLKNAPLKLLATFLEKLFWMIPFLKNKVSNKLYYWSYDYLPINLKNYFDSELSMLILDDVYRGKGLGKIMFFKICKMASENGYKKMKIYTDNASNWKFYLKNGCRKKLEKEIFFCDGDSERVFVLEKDLEKKG